MKDDEFEDLIQSYCNGTLSSRELELLEEELTKSTERRDTFNSALNLDAALKEEAEGFEVEDPSTSHSAEGSKISLWIAAFILISINLFFLSYIATPSQNKTEVTEPTQTTIALITKTLNTERTTKSIPLIPGQQLEPGILSVDKGIMQIELFSGVTLLVHGPTKLDIKDSMHIKLFHGKIRCRIPSQATGFAVNTNELDIVDLGTEFTLTTYKDSNSRLFIHDGNVAILDSSTKKELNTINEGKGVTWHQKKFTTYQASENEVTFQQLAEMDAMQHATKFLDWQKFAKEVRSRSDVILYYSFQDQHTQSRTVLNESINDNTGLDGAIVGALWTEGRWPQKKALNFSSTGDRIRLNIPGEYRAMTFSCWVKIQSFDRWLSSLILTDDFDSNELHWQLSDSGEIILGSRGNGNTFSKPIIGTKDLGRWLYLVTVYDPDKKEIVHFLDGREVHKRKITVSYPIKMGKADIGNWTSNSRNDHSLRSLNGTIDEFIIFSSALSPEEIKDIYEKGLPE